MVTIREGASASSSEGPPAETGIHIVARTVERTRRHRSDNHHGVNTSHHRSHRTSSSKAGDNYHVAASASSTYFDEQKRSEELEYMAGQVQYWRRRALECERAAVEREAALEKSWRKLMTAARTYSEHVIRQLLRRIRRLEDVGDWSGHSPGRALVASRPDLDWQDDGAHPSSQVKPGRNKTRVAPPEVEVTTAALTVHDEEAGDLQPVDTTVLEQVLLHDRQSLETLSHLRETLARARSSLHVLRTSDESPHGSQREIQSVEETLRVGEIAAMGSTHGGQTTLLRSDPFQHARKGQSDTEGSISVTSVGVEVPQGPPPEISARCASAADELSRVVGYLSRNGMERLLAAQRHILACVCVDAATENDGLSLLQRLDALCRRCAGRVAVEAAPCAIQGNELSSLVQNLERMCDEAHDIDAILAETASITTEASLQRRDHNSSTADEVQMLRSQVYRLEEERTELKEEVARLLRCPTLATQPVAASPPGQEKSAQTRSPPTFTQPLSGAGLTPNRASQGYHNEVRSNRAVPRASPQPPPYSAVADASSPRLAARGISPSLRWTWADSPAERHPDSMFGTPNTMSIRAAQPSRHTLGHMDGHGWSPSSVGYAYAPHPVRHVQASPWAESSRVGYGQIAEEQVAREDHRVDAALFGLSSSVDVGALTGADSPVYTSHAAGGRLSHDDGPYARSGRVGNFPTDEMRRSSMLMEKRYRSLLMDTP